MIVRVLCAFSKDVTFDGVREALSGRSVILSRLESGEDIASRIGRETVDLVLADEKVLGRGHSIAAIRELPDRPEVVVFTEGENPERRALHTMRGALGLIPPGLGPARLRETLLALFDRRREDTLRRLSAERSEASLFDFVSSSPAMVKFMETVRKVVDADTSLLILGETGVGKEHLARAIHAEGRAGGPFIPVNCAAIPEPLLESELFGHAEGAFTGASRSRRGYFELAHRGTIFLDEIGDLPQHLQVKLLRVLQERRIQPVGAEAPIGVDVRVMAATNRNLSGDIRSGRFRDDLYYRLAVVSLTVPPLRERREDIPDLVASYVEYFRVRLRRPVTEVSAEAMDLLVRYSWPGNVRELINVIERAVLLAAGSAIVPADLPDGIRPSGEVLPGAAAPVPTNGSAAGGGGPEASEGRWREARAALLDAFERRYFSDLLRRSGGRVGEAAHRAGIAPRALYSKMKRLGFRKEEFRDAFAAPGTPGTKDDAGGNRG